MEPLISLKKITEFTFDTEICVTYIKALKCLESGCDIDDTQKSILKKAGLYKDSKLRVFNHKRKKKNGYTIPPLVKKLFLLWGLEEPSAAMWYKNKTFVESAKILIGRYGFEMIAKTVHVLIPIGNSHQYIRTIRNPQELLSNYGKPYIDRFKAENVFESQKRIINSRKEELNQFIESYD